MSDAIYENQTRIRVNGLLIDDESILLVQLKSPVTDELVWMPPGGGLQFGENMKDCLRREFQEETGLKISVESLIAVHELVKHPFHAVECYFKVQKQRGSLELGKDPEHAGGQQLLKDLQWIPLDQLNEVPVAPSKLPEWIANNQSKKEQSRLYFQTT